MNILVACIHYPVCSGRYIAAALRRLGHEVRTVGPTTGADIWGMSVDMKWAWTPDYADPALVPWDAWPPDLVITADSGYSIAGRLPCPHAVWGQDNHVRDYRLPGAEFDALFLAHSWGQRMGEPNAHWLPPCHDPTVCTDLRLERDLDVVMVGYPYAERMAMVQALAAAGLKVVAVLGAVYDDYNTLYNRAKIALVRSIAGDVTNRVFENAAQGCCVLADRARDFEKLDWRAYRDYVPYSDAADLAHKATSLLQGGKWREYAQLGQMKARQHTWDARCQTLLKTVFATEPQGA
jgi:hypothetical protein